MDTRAASSCDVLDPFIHQHVRQLFAKSEDIIYIAVVDKRQKIISQHGFLDIEPSKLQILHIQASVMADMSSAWAEAFGKMDFLYASFDSKLEMIVSHLHRKMYLMIVRSTLHQKGKKSNDIEGMIKNFQASILCPPQQSVR